MRSPSSTILMRAGESLRCTRGVLSGEDGRLKVGTCSLVGEVVDWRVVESKGEGPPLSIPVLGSGAVMLGAEAAETWALSIESAIASKSPRVPSSTPWPTSSKTPTCK